MSIRLVRTLLPALFVGLTLTACLEKADDDDDDDGGSSDDSGSPGGWDGGTSGGGGSDGGGGGSSSGDSDGDGLSDAEEAELGTDPTEADSDGDGFDDGDELAGGTSPTNPYSRPYAEGGYNIGDCDDVPVATSPSGENNGYAATWDEGDVVENFTLVDQYGQDVDLYSFCGQHVMIAFGAMWCGPCQELAGDVQDLQDEYGPSGFQAIEILIEDVSGSGIESRDQNEWADSFGLETVPVLDDDATAVWPYYELDWGIPTVVHIGPDMRVLSVDEYIYDPGRWL